MSSPSLGQDPKPLTPSLSPSVKSGLSHTTSFPSSWKVCPCPLTWRKLPGAQTSQPIPTAPLTPPYLEVAQMGWGRQQCHRERTRAGTAATTPACPNISHWSFLSPLSTLTPFFSILQIRKLRLKSDSPKVTQLCPMLHTGYSEPLSSSLSISIKRHLISTTSQWWESLKETMLLKHIGQSKGSKNASHCITVVIAVIVIIQQLCETKFMNPFLQKRSQKFQKLKQFSPAPQKIR